jgi:NADPH dehydrogenase (quinone)
MTAALLLPGMAAGAAETGRAGGATKKVLVINAHQKYPGISEGRLNRTLAAFIKEEMEAKVAR